MTSLRRDRFWDTALVNNQLGTTSSMIAVDLLVNLNQDAHTVVTVTRMLIDLVIYPDGMVNAVSGGQNTDLGIAVLSNEAQAAGAIPEPSNSADIPALGWMWRARMVTLNQQDSGTAEMWKFPHLQLDLRAQRIVRRGQTLRLMGDNAVSSGTGFTCRIAGMIRTLVLL